ncbi:MAG TPA: hypothetical protein PK629_04810 [Oscillospiraceae bacterium]|nr:hypothetical protein [Oscillospiraceae bacterium]HPF55050.1 hypothetical protein [Clostridiales bacterium]HPK34867.1 hypothetical protein [Oscillospiraceae bacterium]HPR76169.1 hypothetical protein [Oscillospiraceae bacterium]
MSFFGGVIIIRAARQRCRALQIYRFFPHIASNVLKTFIPLCMASLCRPVDGFDALEVGREAGGVVKHKKAPIIRRFFSAGLLIPPYIHF